ncbi:hypothetical protein ASPCAL14329 [Aspergillus calidoustus]|uniref:Uncharacterized protein n=1 Tax=Aspergillus calidoustus TaxID=454130 RepID=A0A0U5CJR4_ASPCI|nr:hypothetical protein ASPCAL14329 [Aspergillus calidoustus]
MPVATPISGIEKIAVVFARLYISGQDHGVRGLLPYRAGSNYLDHAITTFNHVTLPSTALLGKSHTATTVRKDGFSELIWCVPIGTLSLSLTAIPALKASAWIDAEYALKRTVGATPTPIIHFRTQQIPIFHTIAQAYVVPEYAQWSMERFMDPRVDSRLRHAYAMLFKTVAVGHTLSSVQILSQEIVWRGLLEDNQLIRIELELRGNKIAEGDATVLCIRLASDILHDKISIPPR